MHAPENTAPIYDLLIAERGDVVAIAARTAEETQREADAMLDFGSLTGRRNGEA
ncbi:hypothetical protein C9F11_40695 [Streptomyces sp. YIM 121038]|uniref:hypothetical protein n=1 Tax=unclassified Streptomyces TaxID=2593676 RepID=UPI001163BABC|nr:MULTISPECIES: hypothetical protein [unclassified Streptomyces]QCX81719.1 hypothetical protein C9F11_40695 [Streptomyces sp. YIM 121038]